MDELMEKYLDTTSVILAAEKQKELGISFSALNEATKQYLAEVVLYDANRLNLLDEHIPEKSVEIVSSFYPSFDWDNLNWDDLWGFLQEAPYKEQKKFLLDVFDFNWELIVSINDEIKARFDENNQDLFRQDCYERNRDLRTEGF